MAPTILDVMTGIEARLDTISGLRVSDFTPDQINPPQALVGVPPISQYHAAMSHGIFRLQPTVTLFTSAAYDRTGQRALAAYADPTGAQSIHAAIEGDKTLGGIVDYCIVVSFEVLGLQEVGLVGYYGGRFQLQVVAEGD